MIEAMKHYEAALMAAFPHGAAGKVFEHWNKARQAIEQAEKQEPFGYLWPTGRHPEFRFTQQLRDGVEGTPVYTTPLNPLDSIKSSKTLDAQPQREWVGLTDAEIEEFDYYARDLVMDIEKALKERNNVA